MSHMVEIPAAEPRGGKRWVRSDLIQTVEWYMMNDDTAIVLINHPHPQQTRLCNRTMPRGEAADWVEKIKTRLNELETYGS